MKRILAARAPSSEEPVEAQPNAIRVHITEIPDEQRWRDQTVPLSSLGKRTSGRRPAYARACMVCVCVRARVRARARARVCE